MQICNTSVELLGDCVFWKMESIEENEPIDMSSLMQLESSDDESDSTKNKNKNNEDNIDNNNKKNNTDNDDKEKSSSKTIVNDQDQKKEINIPKIGNPFPHPDTIGRVEELLKGLPVRLESSPTLGRYFVAKRDIPGILLFYYFIFFYSCLFFLRKKKKKLVLLLWNAIHTFGL